MKPRVVLLVPFDATGLERDEQWVGQGIAEVVGLGLDQHPAFVQIEDARVRATGRPDVWSETVVAQAARTLRADAALFGQVTRAAGGDLVVQPRLLEIKAGGVEAVALEPITVPAGELLARLAPPGRHLRPHPEGPGHRRRGPADGEGRRSSRDRSRPSSCSPGRRPR